MDRIPILATPVAQSSPFSYSYCNHCESQLLKPDPLGVICPFPEEKAQKMSKNRNHEGSGPSQRQLRVAEVLRRELAECLGRGDVHDPDLDGVSITVGEVRTTPDLRQAWVYVLPLGGQDAPTIGPISS